MSPILSLIALVTMRGQAVSQPQVSPPFAADIAKFKAMDLKNPPAKGQDLFIGSSSFTRWTDVQTYFPKHKILNRAFGGSTMLDVMRYLNDIVYPYQPKQVVIYCGENDFANDIHLSVENAVARFKKLFTEIRTTIPGVSIVYVSMKPSPSRLFLGAKFIHANEGIKKFLMTQPDTSFVDIYKAMLDAQGQPRPELYVKDLLHMTPAGYHVWAPLIEPILK